MNWFRVVTSFAVNAPKDLLADLRNPPLGLRGWRLVRACLLDSWEAEKVFEEWRASDADKARRGLEPWDEED